MNVKVLSEYLDLVNEIKKIIYSVPLLVTPTPQEEATIPVVSAGSHTPFPPTPASTGGGN